MRDANAMNICVVCGVSFQPNLFTPKQKTCGVNCRAEYIKAHDRKRNRLPERKQMTRAATRVYHQAHRQEMIERNRLYRLANPEKVAIYKKWYKETHHEEDLARARAYNKSHKVEHRLWQLTHPENMKNQWINQNARRRMKTRLVGLKISYVRIKERDRMICGICHKRVNPSDLHFDHIIPLACDGEHAEHNIQVTHSRCNTRKGVGRLPSQIRLQMEVN